MNQLMSRAVVRVSRAILRRAQRCNYSLCPLALGISELLRDDTILPASVTVSVNYIEIAHSGFGEYKIKTPKPMVKFIKRWDNDEKCGPQNFYLNIPVRFLKKVT